MTYIERVCTYPKVGDVRMIHVINMSYMLEVVDIVDDKVYTRFTNVLGKVVGPPMPGLRVEHWGRILRRYSLLFGAGPY